MSEEAFETPEATALAEGDVPSRFARVVAVEHAPDDNRAVVFIEYNEAPSLERYEVLCARRRGGWVSQLGSSGGPGWKWTHDDPVRGPLGVETTGWSPPAVRWDIPAGSTT